MEVQPSTRARRKAERPAEILDAAFQVFVKNGFAATRLEDVAKLAGVTKGTIYFYFETKERVFEEMIRHNAQPMFANLQELASRLEGSHVDRLRALLTFMYGQIAENHVCRETFRFLIAEGRRFPHLVDRHFDELVEPFLAQLRVLLQAGVAAGEFRATPAIAFTEIVLSPAILLNIWWLLFDTRRTVNVADFINAHVDLLLNGLAIERH